jgi:hypothetical protein
MKPMLLIAVMILLTATLSTHAASLFEDDDLSDLHGVNINQPSGLVWIQDKKGNARIVAVGDTIGREQAVVADIQETAITVEQEEMRTRMPVVNPFAGN